MRRQHNQSLADFGIADVASFWLLYTINSYFPALRHIYETRRGHPAALFETMLALAGSLSTFSSAFNRAICRATNTTTRAAASAKLDCTAARAAGDGGAGKHGLDSAAAGTAVVYAAALDQDRYLTAPQLFLAVGAGRTSSEIPERAPSLVKVSAAASSDG